MKKLVFLLAISFMGCLGSKTVSEKTSDKSLIEKTKQDSTAIETVNKGIDDRATFKVAESNTGDVDFDRRVNEAVSNVLRSINFQKSSGDNSYLIRFNEKLNQLETEVRLGETRNKEVATSKDIVSEKSETESNIYKKYVSTIPWWIWIAAFFVFFRQIMGVVSIIYPPARGITSIADLFKPPNRN